MKEEEGEQKSFFGEAFIKFMTLPPTNDDEERKMRAEEMFNFTEAFRLIFKIGREERQRSLVPDARKIFLSDDSAAKEALRKFVGLVKDVADKQSHISFVEARTIRELCGLCITHGGSNVLRR